MRVFRTRGLTKIFHKGEVKLRVAGGVDLDLFSGALMLLVGLSGSVKFPLLNILGVLDHTTDVCVWFRGVELTRLRDRGLTRYRCDHVGFVFQFYSHVPRLSARKNVQPVTDVTRRPMRPEEALDRVGLSHRMDHSPAQFSGGVQQRVAIARAVAKRPEILLCDEPTGSLDSKTGIQVLIVLKQVNEELDTSTVGITHAAEIRKMAHRVIWFQDGKITRTDVNETRLAPADSAW